MARDLYDQDGDEYEFGPVRLSTVVYCTVTGLGVGAFVGTPYPGLVAGGVVGVIAGRWLAPALHRELRD